MNGQQHTTRSGLPMQVQEVGDTTCLARYAYEHPWLVRATHWLNAVTLVLMTASGWEIFAAFPRFGEKLSEAELPQVPSAIRLGGWLGGGLQWHLTFMWLFMATGLVYVVYLALSGHWRHVFFRPRELRGIWPMVRHYLLFGPKPPQQEAYNPLQKLAYTLVIACGFVSMATGWMLYKPVQLAELVALCGGFGYVRLWHFLAMCGFLGFIPGHLLMVALHGGNNFRSMLTGWKRAPDYLTD